MAAYKFECLIDAAHKVYLPSEIPNGWAEIVVVPKAEEETPAKKFFSMLEELMTKPPRNTSPEEIDAYLRRERDSWE